MRPSIPAKTAIGLVRRLGVIRLRDAAEQGVHPEVLRRLAADSRLVKVGRGMYSLPATDASEHMDLALAAARVPRGVICLLSALAYHQIGTQLPHEVWMMIDRRARKPRVDRPPMRFVLGSGPAVSEGVERVTIDGQTVSIFNPAKTVVDCFRYRRHVGLEVALEALRESLRAKRCTAAEIDNYARLCGVSTVLRPYLEASV